MTDPIIRPRRFSRQAARLAEPAFKEATDSLRPALRLRHQ